MAITNQPYYQLDTQITVTSGQAIIVGANATLLEQVLTQFWSDGITESMSIGGKVTKLLKFFGGKGVGAAIVTHSVEIIFDDAKDEISISGVAIDIAGGIVSAALVGAALTALGVASGTVLFILGIAVGGSLLWSGIEAMAEITYDSTIGKVVSTTSELINDISELPSDVGDVLAGVDTSYADIRFYDASGTHKAGYILPNGLGGLSEKIAIESLLASSKFNLGGGTIKIVDNDGDPISLIYQVTNASFISDILTLTGTDLTTFLATGDGVTKNIDNYIKSNETNIEYIHNVLNVDPFLHIPVLIDGVTQIITVNNVMKGGVNLMGDGNGTNIILPSPTTGVDGGSGDDLIITTATYTTAVGNDGEDTIVGTSVDNVLSGGNDNDTLYGSGGNDTLSGGEGDNQLNGGTGSDTADYSFTNNNATVNLGAGTANISNSFSSDVDDILNDIENLILGNGWNSIQGSSADNIIISGDKDDTILGQAGDDQIFGNGGNDSLDGNSGDDILDGGLGNDTIYGGTGEDELRGGGDNDTIYGDADNDVLRGEEGSDELFGGDGDDELFGGIQHDKLYGEGGNDTLIGGSGKDTLDGGDSFDWIEYNSNTSGISVIVNSEDTVNGGFTGKINETVSGTAYTDDFINIEAIKTTAYDDTIQINTSFTNGHILTLDLVGGNDRITFGDNANNIDVADFFISTIGTVTFDGEDGTDSIEGNSSANILDGGSGGDTLNGGAGNDFLYGSSGNDTIYGGLDSDVIYFNYESGAYDKVMDFVIGEDALDFTGGAMWGINITTIATPDNTGTIIQFNNDHQIELVGVTKPDFDAAVAADAANTGTGVGVFGGNAGTADDGSVFMPSSPCAGLNVVGTVTNENLIGGICHDRLEGGGGNDYLRGFAGDDLYVHKYGDGNDILKDIVNGNDQVIMTGVSTGNMMMNTFAGALVVFNIDNPTDQLTLMDQFLDTASGFEFRTFNGINIQGGLAIGNENYAPNIGLRGTEFNDTLTGGQGQDDLRGYGGDDTYIHKAGSGNDTIFENVGENNTVIMSTSGTFNLSVSYYGDLVGTDSANGDTVTLPGQYYNTAAGFEISTFNGINIQGGLTLSGSNPDAGQTVYGTPFDDVIDGMGGNDILRGGTGDDTYTHQAGDGNDTIFENVGENNTVIMSTSGTFNISVSYYGDVIGTDGANGDTVTLPGQYYNTAAGFEISTFNGINIQGGLTLSGSNPDAGEYIYGTPFNDILNGMGGNDNLSGGAGNDTYIWDGLSSDVVTDTFGNNSLQVNVSGSVTWDTVYTDDLRITNDINGETLYVNDYYNGFL